MVRRSENLIEENEQQQVILFLRSSGKQITTAGRVKLLVQTRRVVQHYVSFTGRSAALCVARCKVMCRQNSQVVDFA